LDAKFRSKKGQTRNFSTANNFILPNTVALKTQTSHTEGFETTATLQVGILFTASPLKKQKIKLKFWPVGSFKAPIRFAFKKIFLLAESTGDPNAISAITKSFTT